MCVRQYVRWGMACENKVWNEETENRGENLVNGARDMETEHVDFPWAVVHSLFSILLLISGLPSPHPTL